MIHNIVLHPIDILVSQTLSSNRLNVPFDFASFANFWLFFLREENLIFLLLDI
jgi:hypothetical protein